jgi:hypothetical protein
MATTTNYGWTTPDDTALVKDGAAAIRTLGSSVDTTTKALNPETTLGDIAYRSSSANVKTRLPIGSAGTILTVAGGVPTWAAPAGGGKVLQVVNATYSTATSVTSNTFADSGLSASITPTLASSKILILVNQRLSIERDIKFTGGGIRLLRDATSIYSPNGNATFFSYVYVSGTFQNFFGVLAAISFLDSPSTTSAITYKTQIATEETTNTPVITAQYGSNVSSIILMEIGA